MASTATFKVEPIPKNARPTRVIVSLESLRAQGWATGCPLALYTSDEPQRCLGVLKAWPSFKLAEGTIQVDAHQMRIMGIKIGQSLVMQPLGSMNTPPVSELLLQCSLPLPKKGVEESYLEYLSQRFSEEGYVWIGKILHLTHLGRPCILTVLSGGSNVPGSVRMKESLVYKMSSRITISIQGLDPKEQDTPMVDRRKDTLRMGGLETSIKTVKELIEGSIRDPESFIRLGLKPPKGVLLYGPPGTGKTLLARKVAIDLEAHVLTINGPEIIGKFYGETESRLRDLFHEAEKESPTVIIIDEIDALCPGRGSTGSNEQENRIVATLLTLMDGLAEGSGSRVMLGSSPQGAKDVVADHESQGSPSIPPSVVVIATTNRPDSLDSAIRRPGRLDREVEIGIPSAQDRSSILRVLMSNVPHTLSDDLLDDIASRAHGFVGADLSALCREAAVRSIRRHILQSAGESLDLPVDRVRVDLEDLEGAFTDIRPSGMREIAIEVPRVLWTDIGGQEGVKQKLRESVEWSLKYPEAFTRMGIRPPRGILLYGPPGCSKTLMAKALATEMGVNFIAVKGPELFSKWVGESEKAVQSVFRKARANAPSIIFFDEVDALTVKRGGDGSTSVADRVLSQFLNEMDGVESLVDVTVVAATNRPDIIDAALLRPGRIDRILYIGPPDAEARREIFRIQLARMPCAGDVDVGSLVEHTDGCSGAEVVALCQDAALAAMEESLQVQEVSGRHFDQALKSLQRRITPGMLQFYRNFQEKSGLMSV